MSWAHIQSGTANDGGGGATVLTVVLGSPVAVGDTIIVGTTYGDPTASLDVIDDNAAGKITFTRADQANDGGSSQSYCGWFGLVTAASTPTIRLRFNPTPGTSSQFFCSLAVDHWTGSDLNSVIDGHNSQLQNAPGTGLDAVGAAAVFTPTHDGCLIAGVLGDADNNVPAANPGTNFTFYQIGANVRNEARIQATQAQTAATWTATVGTDHFGSIGFAITPAAGGGGASKKFRHANIGLGTRAGTRHF